jgi:L-lactate dehydrogenase (cytochrome)
MDPEDTIQAVNFGADARLIGRAWAYALAARGEEGISHILSIMKNEMRVAMALTGVTKVEAIDSSVLVKKD